MPTRLKGIKKIPGASGYEEKLKKNLLGAFGARRMHLGGTTEVPSCPQGNK